MTVPVTFSPPLPPGGVIAPAVEDALRDGVMLMYEADDLTRKEYSYDPANPAKGVRISAGPYPIAEGPQGNRKLVLPQLLITADFRTSRWVYFTANGGEKRVNIMVTRIEAYDSDSLTLDLAEVEITANAHAAQLERVLQCGTLYQEDQETQHAKVVDPYRSPLLGSGLYDPDSVVFLNELAPELSRQINFVSDGTKLIGVAYSLIASYTVQVKNREVMTEGGFL